MEKYIIYYSKKKDDIITVLTDDCINFNTVRLYGEDYQMYDCDIVDSTCDMDWARVKAILKCVKNKESEQYKWAKDILENGM